jgi:3-phenylpropionate/trans-cinnamate dioxygenase ferredoxin subunit
MSDLSLAQLQESKPVRLEKNGQAICVARVGEEVFALADTCTHAEASLADGDVTRFTIECWLHGAEFDLRNGQVLTPPATQNLKTYAVHVDGDSVTIQI